MKELLLPCEPRRAESRSRSPTTPLVFVKATSYLYKGNPVVVIWLHSVLIQSSCSMLVAMLHVSAAKLPRTTLLVFLLLQLRIDTGTFLFCLTFL